MMIHNTLDLRRGWWLACLLALAACHDDAATHPYSDDTAAAGTVEGRVVIRLTLPPDEVGDLRTDAARRAVLADAQVLLVGYDKDGRPVNAPRGRATRDGGTRQVVFDLPAGRYRVEVSHPSGAFTPLVMREFFELGIAETQVIAHRFERVALTVRGVVQTDEETPPDTVEVEVRWASDGVDGDEPADADVDADAAADAGRSDDADVTPGEDDALFDAEPEGAPGALDGRGEVGDPTCERGGVLGVPRVADDGSFSLQGPMPLGARLCVVARANGRRRATLHHVFASPREAIVDLGALVLEPEPVELRAFGAELWREPQRLDSDAAAPGVVDSRLVLLDIHLDDVPGALAFPDASGAVPADRVEVVEVSIGDTGERGDQIGDRVRHGLSALPREGLPYLGAVSPRACAEHYDPASGTLHDLLTGAIVSPLDDVVGVTADRMRLPYCLVSPDRGQKTIEVVLTAGGRRYRASHVVELDQSAFRGIEVSIAESEVYRGRIYVDGARDTWQVKVERTGEAEAWFVHLSSVAPDEVGAACPPPDGLALHEFERVQGTVRSIEYVLPVSEAPACAGGEGLIGCDREHTDEVCGALSGDALGCDAERYQVEERILCVHALDLAGNVLSRSVRVGRVHGRSGADISPGTRTSREEAPGDAPPDDAVELPRCGVPALPLRDGPRLWSGSVCPFSAVFSSPPDGGEQCAGISATRLSGELVFSIATWDGAEQFRAFAVEVDGVERRARRLDGQLFVMPLDDVDGPLNVRFIGYDLLGRRIPLRVLDDEGCPMAGWRDEGVAFFHDRRSPEAEPRFLFCDQCREPDGGCEGCVNGSFRRNDTDIVAPPTAAVPVFFDRPRDAVDDTEADVCAFWPEGDGELARAPRAPVRPAGVRLDPPAALGEGELHVRRVSMMLVDRACNIADEMRTLTVRYDSRAPWIRTDTYGRRVVHITCDSRLKEECSLLSGLSYWRALDGSPSRVACKKDDTGDAEGRSRRRILKRLNAVLLDGGDHLLGARIRYKIIAVPASEGAAPPLLSGPLCESDGQTLAWSAERVSLCQNDDARCGCATHGALEELTLAPIEYRGSGDPVDISLVDGLCSDGVRLTPPVFLWVAVEDAVGNQAVYRLSDQTCDGQSCNLAYVIPNLDGVGDETPFYAVQNGCGDGESEQMNSPEPNAEAVSDAHICSTADQVGGSAQ